MGMKVIFAGGGTGGHVYPALSVADVLSSRVRGFRALFVGTRSGLEAKVLPGTRHEIRFIFSRGARGRGIAGKLITMACLSIGFLQAVRILMQFRPDIVFGSGGYASAAVVMAASMLRYRIVLQEQNSIPGLTNRLLASKARRIYLGFEKAKGYFENHQGAMVTGNPLRPMILDAGKTGSRAEFGLDDARPVLLVFGGSQGAMSLNRAAVEYFHHNEGVQGIIQTGERHFEWVREQIEPAGRRVYVSPYITHIHRAYKAADVALARAGALSVSELAAVGLPAILVPYPHAADNHQVSNAEILVKAGGAVMLFDSELSGVSLAETLQGLFGEPERLECMRQSLLGSGRSDAARVIADDMLRLVEESTNDEGSKKAPSGGGSSSDGSC